MVVAGGAVVGQREQDDHLRARGGHVRDPAQHLIPVATLEQVADQDEDRAGGAGDQLLAVGHGLVDVGAAAELGAEQHVDRVAELIGQVRDRGVEGHHRGAQRPDRGQHRPEHPRVHHRGRHRAALVQAEDDVAGHRLLFPGVPDQALGHDGPVLRQVVPQVDADRPVPVDVGGPPGPVRPAGPVQRPGHRRAGPLAQPPLQVPGHRADHGAGRFPGLLGHHLAQRQQRADQVHVWLDGFQHLRFK